MFLGLLRFFVANLFSLFVVQVADSVRRLKLYLPNFRWSLLTSAATVQGAMRDYSGEISYARTAGTRRRTNPGEHDDFRHATNSTGLLAASRLPSAGQDAKMAG
jgi:hypothetical protein